MNKYLKLLFQLNLKTIYFNFKYFPFSQAVKLPVWVSRRVYLRDLRGKIKFECPVKPGMVRLGYAGVGIFDHKKSRSIWEVRGEVIFRGKAVIGHGSKISVGENATLILGNNFTISAESTIVTTSKVQFGDNNLLSWDILVMDTDFHTIKNESGDVINEPKPIIVGDKVWIGCRCLILKGANIPSNCVIGANSVLSKELEKEKSLYAGNPIKHLKEEVIWDY
ncbi:acyltransferase [Chitinophaga flava]|uniref:Transferase n=1 Tax=Chitinophaga flava TaxID=2259036 RepID=A0A365Y4I3_9BACT|nr:acyltransferase [Chitinophaga flava]RBL93506.1 transferase [Chitinophaga flava]